MLKFYKRFDFLLNWLLIVTIMGFIITMGIYEFFPQLNYAGDILVPIVTIILLINVILGILYIISGMLLLQFNIKKKTSQRLLGKDLLVKGLWRTVMIMIILFLIAFILSFFGFFGQTLPNYSDSNKTVDIDNHFHGFPVQNLKIIAIKPIQPTTPGNTWGCD